MPLALDKEVRKCPVEVQERWNRSSHGEVFPRERFRAQAWTAPEGTGGRGGGGRGLRSRGPTFLRRSRSPQMDPPARGTLQSPESRRQPRISPGASKLEPLRLQARPAAQEA